MARAVRISVALIVLFTVFLGTAFAQSCRDYDYTDYDTCSAYSDKNANTCIWCPDFAYGPYCVGDNSQVEGWVTDGCDNAGYDSDQYGCENWAIGGLYCSAATKCIVSATEYCGGPATCRQYDNSEKTICNSYNDVNTYNCVWCPDYGYSSFCVGNNEFYGGWAIDGCDTANWYDTDQPSCESSGYTYCTSVCVIGDNELCLGGGGPQSQTLERYQYFDFSTETPGSDQFSRHDDLHYHGSPLCFGPSTEYKYVGMDGQGGVDFSTLDCSGQTGWFSAGGCHGESSYDVVFCMKHTAEPDYYTKIKLTTSAMSPSEYSFLWVYHEGGAVPSGTTLQQNDYLDLSTGVVDNQGGATDDVHFSSANDPISFGPNTKSADMGEMTPEEYAALGCYWEEMYVGGGVQTYINYNTGTGQVFCLYHQGEGKYSKIRLSTPVTIGGGTISYLFDWEYDTQGNPPSMCTGDLPPFSGQWTVDSDTTCQGGSLKIVEDAGNNGGIDVKFGATLLLDNVDVEIEKIWPDSNVVVRENALLRTTPGTSIGPLPGGSKPAIQFDALGDIVGTTLDVGWIGIGVMAAAKVNITASVITIDPSIYLKVGKNSQDTRIEGNTISGHVIVGWSGNAQILDNTFTSGEIETHVDMGEGIPLGTYIFGNKISNPLLPDYTTMTFEGKDLIIRENEFTSGTHGIDIWGGNNVLFYKNNMTYGLRIAVGSTDITIEGNRLYNINFKAGAAINFSGAANRGLSVIGNDINFGGHTAFGIDNYLSAPNLLVKQNTFSGGGTPIRMTSAENITIDDNTFSNTGGNSIELTSTKNAVITNNVMSPRGFVRLTSSSNALIDNNEFSTTATTTIPMLKTTGGSGINITNNVFTKSPSYGADIASSNVRFEGNTITGNSRGGINMNGGSGNIIKDNKIIDNTWAGPGGAYPIIKITSASNLVMDNNNISNNDDRIRIGASSFTLNKNNITRNSVVSGMGVLYITGDSSGDITNNRIEYNLNNSILIDRLVDDVGDCGMSISGNTISNNEGVGIILLNCKPEETRNELNTQNQWDNENAVSRVVQRWRFNVHVVDDSDVNVTDAYVDVKDIEDAKLFTALMTGVKGLTPKKVVREYVIENGGGVNLYTPHTINGSKTYNPTISGITDKIISSPNTLELKIDLDGGDNTAPVISNVRTGTITGNTAEIFWDADEPSNSSVEYGETEDLGDTEGDATILTENPHSVTLTGLTAVTLYYFNVTSCDSSGNCGYSGDYSFTTVEQGADVTPPTITDVTNGTVTFTTAVILWNTTDEDSDSLVRYNTTPALGLEKYGSAMVKEHSLLLTGLSVNTLYYYNVSSCDASSNCANSTQYTFNTLAVTSAPSISGISVVDRTSSSARVVWVTNYPSNSTVLYGFSQGSLDYEEGNAVLVIDHSILLQGLASSTNYYYNVSSCNAIGCDAKGTYPFTTLSREGEGAAEGTGAARVPGLSFVMVLFLFALAAVIFYFRS